MASIPAKITPHLWSADHALEAARLCASLFPGSRVDAVTPVPSVPGGPAGKYTVVEVTLASQPFAGLERAHRG